MVFMCLKNCWLFNLTLVLQPLLETVSRNIREVSQQLSEVSHQRDRLKYEIDGHNKKMAGMEIKFQKLCLRILLLKYFGTSS